MDDTQVSRKTLEEAPARVLSFLMGVGKSPVIRAALATKGYTAEQHQHAWTLLSKLASYGSTQQAVLIDVAIRDAVVELDAWDEPNFAVIKAALERLHPEQAAFVFQNLTPSQGPQAIVGISLLLDRLDALEKSPERKGTRKADHTALSTLAQRGYTKEERARLRGLVKTAQSAAAPEETKEADERQGILKELYAWISDWGTTAKVVLARRDHQIQVGVAKRKKGKAKKAPGGEGEGSPASGEA